MSRSAGPWRLLVDDGVGAAEGLAVDEALMASYGRDRPPREPTVRLYTYRDHCALVGRYQHLAAEVDLERARALGVQVNRRPTGGGAIVMSRGQLGVAVVTRAPAAERPRDLLERYAEGILRGLASLGIEAGFRGKNDLEAGGRKIAGLGLYLDGNGALLFHASVLADLDVPLMLSVLRIPAAKLADKAVAAVAERVTTVSRVLGEPWDGPRLRPWVAAGIAEATGAELEPRSVEPEEAELASRLVEEKYTSATWLEQRSPQPDATASALVKTPAGLLRAYLAVSGDVVKSVVFTGDGSELGPAFARLEAALTWQPLEERAVAAAVRRAVGEDPSAEGVDPEALAEALVEAGRRAASRELAAPMRTGSCYFPEVTTR
ncbi:biotin/lipoate A/B protein ligase family protein [Aciditerrimonas ferrireducens]|jgi:lipoate-protein ligase A|uniref:Biotin/lipoate A/B protein ligase family protein n=1 Tax=Aciditerrimonas ferrireducens TaxID=667306 RepID=A0ABV6BZ76_9ACTN|nr:biotin/lipoate A/B protein ligase family protein [Aciditerrimonas ferrireducens]MCK4177281.1 lipoate--protein ligase family protein [Aciditerrimonas ferrireducens]